MTRRRIQRLVSAGSILVDIRIDVPALPARGGDVVGSAASLAAGGGFNVLAAAARQGLPALFAGRHGTGPYGACVRAALAEEGIATLLPPSPEADTGFCLVLVEPDGERSFVTSPGVEAALGPRRLCDVSLQPGDAVFVSGYDLCYPDLGPAMRSWIAGMPGGVCLVVDPGPLAADIPPAVLQMAQSRAAIWTMNRREASLLTGSHDLGEIARRSLNAMAPDAVLVVRDGAAGAALCMRDGAGPCLIASPAVVAVDSTGAGDTHTGVLVAMLARGLLPAAAIAQANAAAALSVTRRGPATAPGRDALAGFMANQAGNPGRSALP